MTPNDTPALLTMRDTTWRRCRTNPLLSDMPILMTEVEAQINRLHQRTHERDAWTCEANRRTEERISELKAAEALVQRLMRELDEAQQKAELWRTMAESDQRTIMQWQSTAAEAKLALIPMEAERDHLKTTIARLAAERDALRAWRDQHESEYLSAIINREQSARLQLERDVARLTEWKNAILGRCQAEPLFTAGQWGGDKTGWGYVFEFIGWHFREVTRLTAVIEGHRAFAAEQYAAGLLNGEAPTIRRMRADLDQRLGTTETP